MQKFHKTNEVTKNILFSIWYFLFIGYQVIAGLFLFGVGLIVEFCKALKDMRKEEKGTIQKQHLYPKNWTGYVKTSKEESEREAAMKRWRK
jgi:hypothetical protein